MSGSGVGAFNVFHACSLFPCLALKISSKYIPLFPGPKEPVRILE
jgi:hypothetical protein